MSFRTHALVFALILVGSVVAVRAQWAGSWTNATPDSRSMLRRQSQRGELGIDWTAIWAVDLERGYGGAAIDGGEVFVLDRRVGEGDTLRVLDLETGLRRWEFSYEAPGRLEFAGSRTTPVVVDELVYLCGGFGEVHCLDRNSRRVVWRLNLERDCGGSLPDFGWAADPLVCGDLVILPALGEETGLVALDRFTGDTRWATPGLGDSQSRPVVVELAGDPQVVFLSTPVQGRGAVGRAPLTVSSFDPRTGAPLWQTTLQLTSVPVPPVVAVDGEHLVITGGYGGGTSLLQVSRGTNGYATEEVFHVGKGSQIHPPIVHEGRIFLLANENTNNIRARRDEGGLVCLDLAGRELWSTGSDPYFGLGNMMRLGGYLLIQDGMTGVLRLCPADGEGYRQLAFVDPFERAGQPRRRMWAPMAREGGVFVLRGEDSLRCIRVSAKLDS